METVAPPPADAELNLLTDWSDRAGRSRTRSAGTLSVLAHVLGIVALFSMPSSWTEGPPRRAEPVRHITPLIEPPTDLTQKAPNKGKVNKEFNAAEVRPAPHVQAPPSLPPAPRQRAAAPVPAPPTPQPRDPAIPEPPKVEAAAPEAPKTPALPPPTPPAQPQIAAEEKIRNPFEAPASQAPVTPGQGRIRLPDPSVANVVRETIRQGSSGGLVVGDPGVSGPGGGLGVGMNQAPTQGVRGSNLELKSDPMGVDFRPYLIQILATVRRNWQSVMPESVALGQRGRVGVLFAIDKNGVVAKVTYAAQSGARALDQASIAAISMSNPFPPLPAEFKGDRIVLQFNFAYNMPKQ